MITTFLCHRNAAKFLGLSDKQLRRAIEKMDDIEPINFGTDENPKHFYWRKILIERREQILAVTGLKGKRKRSHCRLPVRPK